MRPLRSFLLLLIFLACFTGLHYIIHADQLFPSINEFVPYDLISNLISGSRDKGRILKEQTESIKISSADTVTSTVSVPLHS